MAGTDRTKASAAGLMATGPAIVLAQPQMGENIGKAARAMANFGLSDLRLVAPRDGWPNERAIATASGAGEVLDRARIFSTVEEAIQDLTYVYAATARDRHMVKPVITPAESGRRLRADVAQGVGVGVLFGGERAGLSNEAVVLSQTIIQAPVNPAFASLNLAQAVLLIAYEWHKAGDATAPLTLELYETRPATSLEMQGLFDHLEAELDSAGFLYPPEKRPAMVRNIRNMLQRGGFTEQDVRTLRGMIKALSQGRPPRT